MAACLAAWLAACLPVCLAAWLPDDGQFAEGREVTLRIECHVRSLPKGVWGRGSGSSPSDRGHRVTTTANRRAVAGQGSHRMAIQPWGSLHRAHVGRCSHRVAMSGRRVAAVLPAKPRTRAGAMDLLGLLSI